MNNGRDPFEILRSNAHAPEPTAAETSRARARLESAINGERKPVTASGSKRALLFLVAVATAAALILVAIPFVVNNSGQREIQVIAGDGEIYGSVAELRSNSDLVVSGRIGSVVESYVDSAGEPAVDERGDDLPGLPKLIISLEVETIIKGDPPGGTVYLVTTDNTGVFTDWDPTFRPGEQVVVFLFEIPSNTPNMSPELAERVEKYGSLYGFVGGSQGVFDVIGDSVRSRSEDAPLEITDLE